MRGFYVPYTSTIDNAPCIAVVTQTNKNTKTGEGYQVFYLREDISPVEASKAGEDASVCGTCPRRHFLGGDCYVLIFMSPQSVWNAYKRGAYKRFTELTKKDRAALHSRNYLRIGAYGDPLSADWRITSEILALVTPRVWTGYTHRWNTVTGTQAVEPQRFLQASCDNLFEEVQATQEGWSTFTATPTVPKRNPKELATIWCPNQASEGEVTCNACGKCNGNTGGVTHIRAYEHGVRSIQKVRKIGFAL